MATRSESYCVLCSHLKPAASLQLLVCGHRLCAECVSDNPIVCPLDNVTDTRSTEQRLFRYNEARQDSPSLTDMIRYLTESIQATERHRDQVLSDIDANSAFMLERLRGRERELQGSLMHSAEIAIEAAFAGNNEATPDPVSLKSPLLYTFFPRAGEVGAWNKVDYTACGEFSNVSYLLKPRCCQKLYCCYKCHDKREDHAWQNAQETICLFCDSAQPYQPLPNICDYCKAYHSAMNNKTK